MVDQIVGTPNTSAPGVGVGVGMEKPSVPFERDGDRNSDVPSSVTNELCDAPVLEKVQDKLKKQLLDRKTEVEERIYEQKRNLARATKEREEAGVQLYDLQCNLAGLHLGLHEATAKLATTAEAHTKAREESVQVQKHYDIRKNEFDTLQEKTTATRLELNNLQNTLKKLEGFNEKMKGEIQIQRRSTYGGEEAVVRIERTKKEQDILIDEMQERIKRLHEKVSLKKAQLAAQQRESKVANVALQEADIEMESINTEKRQITFQWKSTLVVLSRCDLAIQSLLHAIHDQSEQMLLINAEKNNYQKVIAVENTRAGRLFIGLMKIDSAMKEVQKNINRATKKKTKMLQRHAKVLVKLKEVEENIEKIKEEIVVIQQEIEETNKLYLKETTKIHELENRILTQLKEQITLEQKSAHATISKIAELRKAVKQEDTMATELNYDLSRIRVDILNIQEYNQTVTSALKAVNDDLNRKFNLIGKLEAEIKRKHHEIEMKTKEYARLQRQYEKLTRGLTDPNSTPWEAMINSLKSEIDAKSKSSSQNQKLWMTLQTSLVALQNEINNLTENSQLMAYEQGVLVQRRTRVDGQYNALSKTVKELNIGIRVKQNMIIRLNDLIGNNTTLEKSLTTENEILQMDQRITLKDLAKETMEMQTKLEEQKAERDYALKHMNELEHHVMLWRYKISFEIQTQAAIDPNIGQSDLSAMRKEADRMQLQLDGLVSKRKQLIVGLESKVDNRKTINIKIEAMSQRKGMEGPAGFEAGLVKANADLRKAIKDTDKHSVQLEQRLVELEEQKVAFNNKTVEMKEKLVLIVAQQEECRESLRKAVTARAKALLATALYQRIGKRHEDAQNNRWRGLSLKKSLDEELADAQARCNTILRMINRMVVELPSLQQKMEILAIQLDLVMRAPRC